mmetsp:Transcript_142018/g.247383  ORF Transcript_142018/g.247383 Transcript_142018/m.247383 type:complete len:670 (+) Transcript_142018:102-2111(+)
MVNLSQRFASTNGGFERVPSHADMNDALDPTRKKHSCTNEICVAILGVCVVLAIVIAVYAFGNGDPRKIYHGIDFKGNVCGVDVSESYIYWCSKGSEHSDANGLVWSDIDPLSPICVKECPMSAASKNECWDRDSKQTVLRPDYATHMVGHRLCVPQNMKMLDQVQGRRVGNFVVKYGGEVVSCFEKSYPVIVAAVFVGIICAYVYLILLSCLARVMVYFCLLFAFLVPAIYGGYLLYSFGTGNGVDGIPGSGDSDTDLYVGIACCAVAAVFLSMSCCMSGAVNRAVRCVESAAVCMFKTPSLLVEPFLHCFFRAAWLLFLGGILVHLIGTGKPQPPDASGNPQLFEFAPEQMLYIGFIVVMIIWMNDLNAAFSQTAVASAVCNWYFTEKTAGAKLGVPCMALARGYYVAGIHIGSLAFGAITLAMTRPVRLVLLVFVSAADIVDNGLCRCLSSSCTCCYRCFEGFLAELSKNAYIDIAVQGSNFCQATSDAFKVMCAESKAIMILNGATWVFTAAGIGVITGATSLIAFWTVQNQFQFNTPASDYYVEDPVVMTVICACIALVVAVCFMSVFDMVADTMLYCFAYERRWNKQHPNTETKRDDRGSAGFFSSFGWGAFNTKKDPAKKAAPRMSKYAPEELHDMINRVEQTQLASPMGMGSPVQVTSPHR